MSYDLLLIRKVEGTDPAAAARALLGQDEDEIDPAEPSPELEEQKRRLAALLISSNPRLEPFLFDYPALAALNEITEHEARLRFRHIELNGPDDGNGIQITLHDDRADITVPCWHQACPATVRRGRRTNARNRCAVQASEAVVETLVMAARETEAEP